MERCNEAHIGSAIKAIDLRMGVMEIAQNDWLPFCVLQGTVDAFGFGYNLVHEVVVALDVGTTRRTDLNERELPLVVRILVQETLNALEALENAFGVVNAID